MTQKSETPQILSLCDMNEGVYLASGGRMSGASWNINVSDVQTWNGTDHVFKAECTLNAGEETNIDGITIRMQFNYPLTSARVDGEEFVCSYSGNTVTLVSGAARTFGPGAKIYAQIYIHTGDEATSSGLSCTTYSCV